MVRSPLALAVLALAGALCAADQPYGSEFLVIRTNICREGEKWLGVAEMSKTKYVLHPEEGSPRMEVIHGDRLREFAAFAYTGRGMLILCLVEIIPTLLLICGTSWIDSKDRKTAGQQRTLALDILNHEPSALDLPPLMAREDTTSTDFPSSNDAASAAKSDIAN